MFRHGLLVSLLLSAACAEGDPAPAVEPGALRFAEASEAERQLAVSAATGELALEAFFVNLHAGFDASVSVVTVDGVTTVAPGACPRYVPGEEREKYVVDAPCVGPSSGTKYVRGEIEAPVGASPFEAGDQVFRDFVVDKAGGQVRYDGRLVGGDPAAAESHNHIDHVRDDGVAVHAKLDTTCTGGTCRLDAGSRVDIAGLGGFTVSSEAISGADGAMTGYFELRGADVLRLDLADPDADDCLAYTIDGVAAGELCGHELDSPPPPPDLIEFVSPGCTGSQEYDVLVVMSQEATGVRATLRLAGQDDVVVDLAQRDPADVGEGVVQAWGIEPALVLPTWDCDAFVHDGATLIEATFADGTTACEIVGDLFPESTGCE